MISESGFVWSMNCESWLEPKNSRTAAVTGLALIRSRGIAVLHLLMDRHLLLDRALHSHEAEPELVLQQFAHGADAAVAEVVDVVVGVIDRAPVEGHDRLAPAAQFLELQRIIDHVEEVLRREQRIVQARSGRPILMLNLRRPTREVELRASKNIP